MSRPRFLADHNLNEHIVAGVSRLEPGIDFLRARDLDLRERSDADLIRYAEQNGLLIVSHDVNTLPAAAYAQLADGGSFPGLLMVRQTSPISSVIRNLVLIWAASELEEWRGEVVFLPFE